MKFDLLKISLAISLVTIFSLTSCEDDLQPDYPSPQAKPDVSIVGATSYTVNEGEEVTITLSTSKVLNEDMTFKLEILDSSTATDVEDFEVDLDPSNLDFANPDEDEYYITFPKYEETFSFVITTFKDYLPDNAEVANFKISPLGDFNGNVDVNSQEFSITINQPTNILSFMFDWNQEFDFSGTTYSLCDIGYDNDFVYADASYNLVAYLAGTAACPEVAEIDLDTFGDGTYHIFQNVWDDGGLQGLISPPFSIPVTTYFSKGAFGGSYVQDAANAVDSDFGSDPSMANPVYVVSFTISGQTVTMFDDTTSATIGSGKMSKPQLKGLDKLQRRVK